MTVSLSDDNQLLAEARRLRLKKRFGQNFLVRGAVLDRIVEALSLSSEDTVLEIGPGAGFLTERLLAQAGHVVSVELERDMIAYLQAKFGLSCGEQPTMDKQPRAYDQLTLVSSDILRFDILKALETGQLQAPLKIVGNIPYNITSAILFYLCGEASQTEYPLRQKLDRIVLLVQKEVAERVTAQPGCKAYNHMSIALQLWFETRMLFDVPPNAFLPAPKVTSSVIRLIPRPLPKVPLSDPTVFARLIKCAFAQKRKTLRNSLLGSRFAEAGVLDTMFAMVAEGNPAYASLPGQRAETIAIEAFGALADAYASLHHQNPGQN